MRIVLCDDHRLFAETLEVLLTARGHVVVATTTEFDAALAVLESQPVDLCLLDLQLRDQTALPLIPVLLDRAPATKVVILSASDDAGLLREALAAGALAVARKADDIDHLIAIVERVAAGEPVPPPAFASVPSNGAATATTPAQRLASFLTAREREVLEHLVRGESTTSLAASIGIRHSTARTHVQNVLSKLGVHSKLEAVSFAIAHGIVEVPDDGT